jgi:predicted ATPase with chaperone activity
LNNNQSLVCNADMRIGEIRQFCQLQAEDGALSVSKCQSLMRAATSCCAHGAVRESTAIIRTRLCTAQCHRTRSVKLSRTIADLVGSEEIQSAHLAEALHLRSSKDYDVMNVFLENDIRFIN